MSKKKKVEPIVEPVEVAAEAALPEPVFENTAPEPEPLLTVRVMENFKDGALAKRFADLGYPLLWKAGETRKIPMGLFVRCKRSGAKFEL